MLDKSLPELVIGIKGAGEMGSAIAWRLYMANFRNIFMMEAPYPLAVRRRVAFCEAIHDGTQTVENVTAVLTENADQVFTVWQARQIPVLVDPQWTMISRLEPDVVIDAILAKKNLGTHMGEARLVIGLGPGFSAGEDVHLVIETNRGHDLGRIITRGPATPNTGMPGNIGRYTGQRILRAPAAGRFVCLRDIGDPVKAGDIVGMVEKTTARVEIDGVLRGLIRTGTQVSKGLKVGDIDPRGDAAYCHTISDKARAIGGSVLEAVLRTFMAHHYLKR
ncbi:MAG TPA: selenium-dependent molybdenum cofactor biosynthesis protein YqeB [Desulfatirhabdiaceae bacterium]|nr:selenium-dependent molybdenum cofactor biosynthesis protein YqeB [Desulfatirhabdiaceae bacterium]